MTRISDIFAKLIFNITVAVILVAIFLLIWRAFNPLRPFDPRAEAVAAMRVPPQAMSNLYLLAQWYDLPFGQLLAMYAISNDFFSQNDPAIEMDALRKSYVSGFNRLRRQYVAGDILPYFQLFENLTAELERFPIPQEYSYIFSDTWCQTSQRGTNILDKENIRGRIPVLSMTAGGVARAGWHNSWGYHVVTVTESGSRILYAHLDKLQEGLSAGQRVQPGQKIGSMGSSGEGAQRVNLHIGISPAIDKEVFSYISDGGGFWINPYPFLRHMEEKMYIFPQLVHTSSVEDEFSI